eukprot:TRINITY_DN7737_c0_g1_i3.p1 TRINITY_DN7737_c0_g1~~TRINITY_DN7737_c0_g1_i3.p1  ORF type:complete len:1870 (-),score=707.33 TRINITY_DN7737_c0_g1_i3:192-5801(-)
MEGEKSSVPSSPQITVNDSGSPDERSSVASDSTGVPSRTPSGVIGTVDLKINAPISFEVFNEASPLPLNKQLQSVSEDDVKVIKSEKLVRTESSPVPKEISDNMASRDDRIVEYPGLHPHVYDQVRFFSENWSFVEREKSIFTNIPPPFYEPRTLKDFPSGVHVSPIEASDIPDQIFECDQNEGEDKKVVEQFDSSLMSYNEDGKSKPIPLSLTKNDRTDVFQMYQNYPAGTLLDIRKTGSLPASSSSNEFELLVEIEELQMALGEIEPLFGTMALWDVKKEQKISENFNFDLNSSQTYDMLGSFKGSRDAINLVNKAIFNLSYQSPDIFLVIVLYRVLRKDEDDPLEPYFKFSTIKPKDKSKLQDEIKEYCLKLGKFKQVFGISVVPLFDEKGELLISTGETRKSKQNSPSLSGGLFDVKSISKLRGGDIPSHIIEVEKERAKQKAKTFPGNCKLGIYKIVDYESLPFSRLDPSLQKVKPFNSDHATHPEQMAREIRKFKTGECSMNMQLEYVNELCINLISANFSNYPGSASCRNIAVDVKVLESDADPNADGLPFIIGKSYHKTINMMMSREISSVTYHNKKPKFLDEVKIKLPPIISEKHHLFFTFYHIQCDTKKAKKEEKAEIGFAFIPLLKSGVIMDDGLHSLPVGTVFQPHYRSPKVQEVIKWMDSKKGVFNIKTKLTSSVYCQDESIQHFLSTYDKSMTNLEAHASEIIEAVEKLSNANIPKLIQMFPVVMKKVLRLFCDLNVTVGESIFMSLVAVVEKISIETLRDAYLESYLTYVFDNSQSGRFELFEQLSKVWALLIRNQHPKIAEAFKYSWFFFGLISKSMVLHLNTQNSLKGSTLRSDRFEPEALSALQILIQELVKSVRERITSLNPTRLLNAQIAYFMKDLLSILDRSFIFKMIYLYSTQLDSKSNSESVLVACKFSFLMILNDHEHYVPLNSPLERYQIPSGDILEHFWQNHFLVGLLLREISICFSQRDPSVLIPGMDTLRMILLKHNFDARYAGEKSQMESIISMYFPFIIIILDNLAAVKAHCSLNEKRNIFICWLYILKGMSLSLLKEWWSSETVSRKIAFFQALHIAIDIFEYSREYEQETGGNYESSGDTDSPSVSKKGKNAKKVQKKESRKSAFPIMIPRKGGKSAKDAIESYFVPQDEGAISPREKTPVSLANSTPSLLASPLIASPMMGKRLRGSKGEQIPTDPKREANLSCEVSFTILETVLLFVQDFKDELLSKNSHYLVVVFETFTFLMSKNQSNRFLSALFGALAYMIVEFKKPLFRFSHSICEELSFQIIRYCNFKLNEPRAAATTLLYILISNNYKEMKNFSRAKLQIAIAISKLVGISSKVDFTNLETSISAVVQKGKQSKFGIRGSTNLPEQVEEMAHRLFGVMRDSQKMKESFWDPERTSELYYQISKGFIDSPDLRVTWLENLASFHKQKNNKEEYAQTKILTSALVSHYLKICNRNPIDLPDHFQTVFPNVDKELLLPPPSVLETLEGEVCIARMFSDEGFTDLLKDAITALREGHLYESCVEVYQNILPICRKKRDYNQQKEFYTDLAGLCSTIVVGNESNNRLFSNYYRVAFIGKKFDEIDGSEFIYKEPSEIRLVDFTERLLLQYKSHFGAENVHLLPNTKSVVISDLNPDFLYLQIVSVEFHHTADEKKNRDTLFEQNNNIHRFTFETPFTKNGKAHGDLGEQYKRKTFLTVESKYPFVVKRLKVIEKTEVELSPIETALDIIDRRINTFRTDMKGNFKGLFMALHGSLLAQVNAGPMEICRIFLGHNMTKYARSHVRKLVSAMAVFVETLGQALKVNSTAIKPDQLPVQEEMEGAFQNMKEEFRLYMNLDNPEEDSSDSSDSDSDSDD